MIKNALIALLLCCSALVTASDVNIPSITADVMGNKIVRPLLLEESPCSLKAAGMLRLTSKFNKALVDWEAETANKAELTALFAPPGQQTDFSSEQEWMIFNRMDNKPYPTTQFYVDRLAARDEPYFNSVIQAKAPYAAINRSNVRGFKNVLKVTNTKQLMTPINTLDVFRGVTISVEQYKLMTASAKVVRARENAQVPDATKAARKVERMAWGNKPNDNVFQENIIPLNTAYGAPLIR